MSNNRGGYFANVVLPEVTNPDGRPTGVGLDKNVTYVRKMPPWTAAACCRFGSGSLLPNEEFVNSLISERFSTAGLWFGKLQQSQ
jgi:hypothetical protein